MIEEDCSFSKFIYQILFNKNKLYDDDDNNWEVDSVSDSDTETETETETETDTDDNTTKTKTTSKLKSFTKKTALYSSAFFGIKSMINHGYLSKIQDKTKNIYTNLRLKMPK
tara:strand:+ start:3365 stop:3700 length:336 start_codon:yes stop_codon:yes gene_type:complete